MDRKDGKASELSSASFDGTQGEYSGFRSPLSLTEGPLPTARPFRMVVRLATRETHLVDLLDRILDKGIVIDVWARLTVAGVDLGITVKARIVVASIETYLEYAGPSRPRGR
jgi:gas vesicle structural protein